MTHPLSLSAVRTLAIAGLGSTAFLLSGCSMFDSSPSVKRTNSDPPLASLPAPVSSERVNAENDEFVDPFEFEGGFAASNTKDPIVAANRAGGVMSVYGNLEPDGRNRVSEYDGVENLTQVSFGVAGADFDPDISGDGKYLVFSSTQHRETSDIYVKRVGGRSLTQLTSDPAEDVMPTFSPDSGRVAYASNRAGTWDIYVMNSSGGQSVQLTSEESHELHPTWSPDGSMLAYSRLGPVSRQWELWAIEVENPAVKHFIGYGLFPEWNPVTDKILFQRARERDDRYFSVWTIDYIEGQGENPTEIVASSDAAIVNPTWAPDGRRIAFSTIKNPAAQPGERPHKSDLWIVNIDGSGRANLTGGRFVNLMPTWGQSNRLFFISDRSGRDTIWSILPEKAMRAAGNPPLQDLANVPTDRDD